MKARTFLSAVLLLVLSSCAHDRAVPTVPQSVDIENLRSIPYASWTESVKDRTVSGVTRHDRRANPGLNVFTDDAGRAFLMDLDGRVVHQWRFEGASRCEFARVLPNGDAFGVSVPQGVWKVSKDSSIQWIFRGGVNHDLEIAPDGSLIVPKYQGMTIYKGRRVTIQTLAFLTVDGALIDTWSTWSAAGPKLAAYHPPLPLDFKEDVPLEMGGKFDYYHLNSVQILPDTRLGRRDVRFAAGNLLISLRNTNLIAILDRKTRNVAWSWGPGQLDFQHAPVMLENGNILVFDNGPHRQASRVIEISPPSGRIVWEYPAKGQPTFLSRFRGNAQRLPNGNTLICDADNGHAFEVTRKGETVWDFWSPLFNDKAQRRQIYRMNRVFFDPSVFADRPPVRIEDLSSISGGENAASPLH